MPVKPDTAFDCFNHHLYQGTTVLTKIVSIILFEASKVFVTLLVKFISPSMRKIHPFFLSPALIKNSSLFPLHQFKNNHFASWR